MKFTPGQVQETLQLTPATFRHWKNALPPLSGRNGYTPCFTPGDLLALALIKTLTEDIGIRIGHLQTLAGGLFEYCSQPWAGLERSVLIVEPLHSAVNSAPESHPLALDGHAIVLRLRPIIAELRERLLVDEADSRQRPLRFPPTVLGSRRRSQSQ